VVMEIRNIRRVLTEKQVEGRYGIG
jgi:hypothetical protein